MDTKKFYKTDEGDVRVTRIDPTKVVRAYSGRTGCMCGCRGKYSESRRGIATIVRNAMATDAVYMDRNGIAYAMNDEHTYSFYFE